MLFGSINWEYYAHILFSKLAFSIQLPYFVCSLLSSINLYFLLQISDPPSLLKQNTINYSKTAQVHDSILICHIIQAIINPRLKYCQQSKNSTICTWKHSNNQCCFAIFVCQRKLHIKFSQLSGELLNDRIWKHYKYLNINDNRVIHGSMVQYSQSDRGTTPPVQLMEKYQITIR